jgi:hypothetical protein
MTFQDLIAAEPAHPLIPLPTERQLQSIHARFGGGAAREFNRLLHLRRTAISKAEVDPLQFAPSPKWWKLMRRVTDPARKFKGFEEELKLLILLGGNRSGKTRWCARHIVAAALKALPCPDGLNFLVCSPNIESSIAVAQAAIWHYLPPEIKALNGSRSKTGDYYVHYSLKEGFSERVLVLPRNGARFRFDTFNNDPSTFEGYEFGCRSRVDLSWWFDEDAPWPWIEMATRRGRYRPGFGAWSFTPVGGITAAIRETTGTGRVILQRRADLLPANRVLVDGCKAGHVPLLAQGTVKTTRVMYVHSDLSPFGSGTESYAKSVSKIVEGKPEAVILRTFYGFAKDITGLAFAKFSRRVHVVRNSDLPEVGTNYQFLDPAGVGSRSWFWIYVRVSAGNPRRVYIWRDFPDEEGYGAWAVPTTRTAREGSSIGMDGDPGPAQKDTGVGVSGYKRLMLRCEEVELRLGSDGRWIHKDPQAIAICERAMRAAKQSPVDHRWSPQQVDQVRRELTEPLRYEIFARYIDPRAAAAPHASEDGGRTLVDMLAEEDTGRSESAAVPGLEFIAAYSGRRIDDGSSHVKEMLDYDETQPVVQFVNAPELYVTESAAQVIWAFENYTGLGGEKGACKDPMDATRYMAQCDDLLHVSPGMLRSRAGCSSY